MISREASKHAYALSERLRVATEFKIFTPAARGAGAQAQAVKPRQRDVALLHACVSGGCSGARASPARVPLSHGMDRGCPTARGQGVKCPGRLRSALHANGEAKRPAVGSRVVGGWVLSRTKQHAQLASEVQIYYGVIT